MKDNSAMNKSRFSKHLDQNVSKFMRKGKMGDWKNYFSKSQSAQIDAMYDEKPAGRGLHFKYDSANERDFLKSKL